MSVVIVCTFLTFLFYYLASIALLKPSYRLLFIVSFIVASFFLRYFLNPNVNNDYYLYFDFKIFHQPEDFLSIFITEPYLYLVYSFFRLFSNDKETIFLGMYWFNFLFATIFFVWLWSRKDVDMWKKMFLFSCYYFFFTFVLLRNGPVYLLFGYFFYYTFRGKTFNLVLLTPFMHISSLLMLVTYFHKRKYYFVLFSVICILVPLLFFLLLPVLSEMLAFQTIISKVHIYTKGMPVVGVLHKLFFVFISLLVLIGGLVYKKQLLHPILLTTLVFYYSSFFINPIVAFRFSPYVFLSLFLYNFEGLKYEKWISVLNFSSILLFPYFLYALYHTHHL